MPLSPLPESNTKRYFLVYTADTVEHRAQIRVANTVSDAAAVLELAGLITDIQALLYVSTHFNSLEVADEGSDIRNPVSGWTAITGSGDADEPDINRPLSHSFVGRSPTGRKVRLFLFGTQFGTPTEWRVTPGGGSAITTAIARLNSTASFYLAIDGSKPIWYPYVNVKYNDHYVDAQRA